MAKILIIDDDEMFCQLVSKKIKEMEHEVDYVLTMAAGISRSQDESFDLVLLDVMLPDGNGLDALPKIIASEGEPEVIIITGAGDVDGAEIAIRNGAWDYIEKPSSLNMITLPIMRALQFREVKNTSRKSISLKREGIIGNSPKMKACLDMLAQASSNDANVLISGETGTGKELFAWAIHKNSRRADGNFVVVDCAALHETLTESVLFGHIKGAFTGAIRTQDGLIRQANGGTLFLDEAGELPLSIQKVFLRVLQEHRFRPLGADHETRSDFRLVVATNRDLKKMVEKGEFRGDLLFRFQSVSIDLPPLREHPEDIKELVIYHMTRLCERYGKELKGFSPDFFDVLKMHDWPGNVRELISTIDRALAAAQDDPILFPQHLPVHIRIRQAQASLGKEKKERVSPATRPAAKEGVVLPPLKDFRNLVLIEKEKQYLRDLMSATAGVIKDACKLSGLSRPRLYALLSKYNITRPKG
ncbi:MAG: sigma-54 dependent transcriptional regulator [Smithellaceae bacterium]|nr:sigma-54 dependent transcriptional regulator [Smithellaceae bacterium]